MGERCAEQEDIKLMIVFAEAFGAKKEQISKLWAILYEHLDTCPICKTSSEKAKQELTDDN